MSAEIYLQLVFDTILFFVFSLHTLDSYASMLNHFIFFFVNHVFSDPNTTLLLTSFYKAKTHSKHGIFVMVKFFFSLRTNPFHHQNCPYCSPSVMERFFIRVTVKTAFSFFPLFSVMLVLWLWGWKCQLIIHLVCQTLVQIEISLEVWDG